MPRKEHGPCLKWHRKEEHPRHDWGNLDGNKGVDVPVYVCPGVEALVTIRYYDAFDGWVDIDKNITKAAAEAKMSEYTKNGTKSCEKHKAAMGEYYCVFPADTTMMMRPETLGR